MIGGSGTGKTLLCQVLSRQFSARFQSVVLSSGHLPTRRALLQALLFELAQPYQGLDEGELRLALVNHLTATASESQGLVLIVDEAHSLSWRLLEEVRILSNLSVQGQPQVRVLLAGSPLLEESFTNPRLESFSQRISARCYLAPMDRAETAAYVRHQIAMSGGHPEGIVGQEALESIYLATDGIPRLINQVCDHALILASLAGRERLERATIEEAWADLQQLPAPWQHQVGDDGEAGPDIVEFGDLDDPQDDLSLDAAREMADDISDDFENHFADELSDTFEPSAAGAADAATPESAHDETPKSLPFPRDNQAVVITHDVEYQLNAIEQHLTHYDEDFKPAGLIGPEVELVYPDPSNPFQEAFAEEEVIVDRFTMLDTGSFAGFPTVTSAEGRELGSRLKAVDRTPPAARSGKEHGTRTIPGQASTPQPTRPFVESFAASPAGQSPASPTARPAPPASKGHAAHTMPHDSPKHHEVTRQTAAPIEPPVSRPAAAASLAPTAASHVPPPQTTGVRPPSDVMAGSEQSSSDDDEDFDLIVIEDDPVPVVTSLRSRPLVRRQEYRQLFAKLRRG